MTKPRFLPDRGGRDLGPSLWLLPLLMGVGLGLSGFFASGGLCMPERKQCVAVGGYWERTSGIRYGSARCVMPDGAGTHD